MKTKTLLLFILVVTCILVLTSCHGSKKIEKFDLPESFDTSKNTEISFWAKNDTNINQVNVYKKAIEDFQALYPNIKVNLKLYTDYNKIYNDIITNISTQTTPNICITYPDHIATYITGENVVVPLNDLFTNENYGPNGKQIKFESPEFDEIIEKFREECKIGQNYYAVPFMRSTEACYINKTYVEKLGYEVPDILTWDFIWEVSEKATQKDANGNYKVNGQKVMIPFIYKSTDNMMIQMAYQKNIGYYSKTGEITLFNDDTAALLKEISKHAKTGAFSTFKISSYPANFLNAGQCIFAIDSTAGSTWMGTDAPLCDIAQDKIVEFETALRPVPQFDTENIKMISQGPSVCIFNKSDPQDVIASWLFTQFLLTDEVQISYSQTEGYIPVTTKAQNSDVYKEYINLSGIDNNTHYSIKIDAVKMFMSNIDNTFVTPVWNGSASLRNAAGELIENVVKSTRRKQTVDDEFIKNLYSDTKSLYRLNQKNSSEYKTDLGKLPVSSVILLISITSIWVILGVIYLISNVKKYKEKKNIC